MFKENFIQLCNKNGESPSSVCRKVGITPATFSCWTETSVPRQATLMRIADYFGVSVEYLLGNEKGPGTDAEPENGLIICRNGVKENRPMTEEELAAFDAFYNTYIKKK